ncbi:MAG: DUF4440 domain-containing protein [Saprospiraceae bacterium]
MFKPILSISLQLCLCALLLGAATKSHAQSKSVKAIQAVMKKQSEDWNKGDIAAFMEGYWKSDQLQFIGSRGPSYGWQKTYDNYKKSYPDKSAMGQLEFEVSDIDKRSRKVYTMIGSWKLSYPDKEALGGYFLLVWKKIKGKWVIVADHTNLSK